MNLLQRPVEMRLEQFVSEFAPGLLGVEAIQPAVAFAPADDAVIQVQGHEVAHVQQGQFLLLRGADGLGLAGAAQTLGQEAQEDARAGEDAQRHGVIRIGDAELTLMGGMNQ